MTETAPKAPSSPLFHRLARRDGRRIDFTIAGDLLITAILTNRSDLRRFEFAEATRAGFCLMGGCQDCWVDLADGRRLRACSTPVEAGMAVLVEGGRR